MEYGSNFSQSYEASTFTLQAILTNKIKQNHFFYLK